MKAYYCTCLVKTGVQVYLVVSTVVSVGVLSLVLQKHVLKSMVNFFRQAFFTDPRPEIENLDFDLMRRSIFVLTSLVVCACNILLNGLAAWGVRAKRHCFLTPWLVGGAVEILGLLVCGCYHLYLLWATHENIIYKIKDDTLDTKDSSVDMVLALRSSLSFGELCVYTALASAGVVFYLAFFVYAWVMVKVLRDQLKEQTNETAFVMKIVKQL